MEAAEREDHRSLIVLAQVWVARWVHRGWSALDGQMLARLP